MRFNLYLSTDNAAFGDETERDLADERTRVELARILRRIANDIEDGKDISMYQTIFDINGNDVGRYALKDESYFQDASTA